MLQDRYITLHAALGGPEELHLRELRFARGEMVVALGRYGEVSIPMGNLPYLAEELSGVIEGPRSGVREIDAVLNGDAELLGKGHDGLVYRVGDRAVKVAATVPFHPRNPGHRTPEAAAERLRTAVDLADELSTAGVPGLARGTLVEHARRAFWIRDYYELPKRFTRAELHAVQETVLGMHEHQVTLNDQVQVGRSAAGAVELFDLGSARCCATSAFEHRRDDDISELAMFYERHGARFYLRRGTRAERQLDFLLRHGHRMTAAELDPHLRSFSRQLQAERPAESEKSRRLRHRTWHLHTRTKTFSDQDYLAVLNQVRCACEAGRPAKARSLPRRLVGRAVRYGEMQFLDPQFRYVLITPAGVQAANALTQKLAQAQEVSRER